jgi:hypothetical protein
MALRKHGPQQIWFYEVYDAIVQQLPIGTWPSIRQQPVYQRYRYRFVHEALKESRMKTAVKAKAMAVVDIGNL